MVQEAHAGSGCGRRTGSAGSRSPTAAAHVSCRAALRASVGCSCSGRCGTARPAPLPLRRFGRGADRAGGARVLHRARRPGLRALRHDGELGDRHRQLRRPHEARHGRRALPRHRLPHRRGDRRDPGQARRRVRRLLGQAGQDRRDVHRRRLADDRRRRRVGRRHPRPHRRPDQAHHHHLRRQERLAVGDREQPQDVAVRQGGDGDRRRPQLPHGADRHRARHRRRLGPAAQHPVHDLPRPVREAGGDRAHPGRRRHDQRQVRHGREHPQFACSPRSSTTRTAS